MSWSTRSKQVRTTGLVGFGAVVGVVATIGMMALFDHMRSLENAKPLLNVDFNTPGSLKGPHHLESNELQFKSVNDKYDLSDLDPSTSDFARSFSLYKLLIESDQERLEELLKQAQKISSPNRRHATERAIVQSMAARDPKRALAHIAELPSVRHDELTATVFGEWSISNLDSAVMHAETLDDSQKNAALRGMLKFRDDLSLDIRRQVSRKLGNEEYLDELTDELAISSYSGTPKDAWNMLVNDDRDDVAQLPALIRVAKALVTKYGIGSLDQLSDSLGDDAALEVIARSAAFGIAREDPQLAFQQTIKLSRSTREMVLPVIAEAWGRVDPKAALDSLTSIESISLRMNLQESVLRGWAGDDPETVFENLEILPKGLRKMAEDQAMYAIARSNPLDAVDFLGGLTDPDRKLSLAKEIALNWSQIDVYEALDWAGSGQFSDPELQWQVLSIVLRELAQHDLELAMQTALDQPLPRSGEGLESVVIAELVNTDIDKAIELLPEVRDGRTRFLASVSTAKALVQNGHFDRAIELHEELPASRHSNYFSSVFAEWSDTDPDGLFASLDELPSEQLRKSAATQLLVASPFSPRTRKLSRDQASKVRKILWPRPNQNRN